MFKDKAFALNITKYRAAYMVRIRPQVQTLTQKNGKTIDDKDREYKHLDILIVSDKPLAFQSSTRIKLTALPLPHPKTQRTTLLAYKVSFPESTEKFSTEKLDCLKSKFEGKTVKKTLELDT